MLKIDIDVLDKLESQREGIIDQILRYEKRELPVCSHCGSSDTADVIFGIIGRTIYLAGATTKVHLLPNPPSPGEYFCNACGKYFD